MKIAAIKIGKKVHLATDLDEEHAIRPAKMLCGIEISLSEIQPGEDNDDVCATCEAKVFYLAKNRARA